MKCKPLLAALALVLLMLALAQYTGRQEVIFPEIAALAFGAWVMDRMPWAGPPFALWFSPTLAAVTGVLVQRWLPEHPVLAVPLAFGLVAVELRLCRSGILPAISAAILPILTRVDSWWYPVSVCVLAGAIALGRAAPRRAALATAARAGFGLGHWTKLCALVALAAGLALTSGWIFLIAPPLFVLLIELSDPGNPARRHPVKIVLLVSLSAAIGSAALAACARVPGCPSLMAAGLALPAVLWLQYGTGLFSPPALALTLLPLIVPPAYAAWYPLHVALGCVCVVASSRLLFQSPRREAAAEQGSTGIRPVTGTASDRAPCPLPENTCITGAGDEERAPCPGRPSEGDVSACRSRSRAPTSCMPTRRVIFSTIPILRWWCAEATDSNRQDPTS